VPDNTDPRDEQPGTGQAPAPQTAPQTAQQAAQRGPTATPPAPTPSRPGDERADPVADPQRGSTRYAVNHPWRAVQLADGTVVDGDRGVRLTDQQVSEARDAAQNVGLDLVER
jgi:hypothetical protein